VLATDADGTTTYYRGGPGKRPGSSGPSSGSSGSSSRSCGSSSPNSSNSSSPGSGKPGKNTGPYGPLTGESGPYGPNTIDWDPGDPPSNTILDDGLPCSAYDGPFKNAINAINNAKIPYNPFSTNSNAFANDILTRSGLNPGSPPVWAPGWGSTLPR
jgi:hypothetical protein